MTNVKSPWLPLMVKVTTGTLKRAKTRRSLMDFNEVVSVEVKERPQPNCFTSRADKLCSQSFHLLSIVTLNILPFHLKRTPLLPQEVGGELYWRLIYSQNRGGFRGDEADLAGKSTADITGVTNVPQFFATKPTMACVLPILPSVSSNTIPQLS